MKPVKAKNATQSLRRSHVVITTRALGSYVGLVIAAPAP